MSQTVERESVAEIAEVVDEHRDVFEAVAEGNDESARMAQNILDAAEDVDV
ncbi:hypothetical protein [Halococcus sp. AFM35]|uniref:hypothetical protein n=1 Tax=Halococcus sp. AFM35 TaxID=3421653 RepID=UPI003EBE9F3F